MSRLLLLEDDVSLIDGLRYSLERNGFELEMARTVREARSCLKGGHSFDLLLLDVTLPDGTGFMICEEVRSAGDTTPIIFLTASDEETSIIRGLDSGGDDYITKPFAIEELLARIRVALKLHGSAAAAARKTAEPGNLTWRKLSLSEQRHQVTWAGEEISLTNREFRMLKTLLENRDIVLSRETLLEKVCGYDYMGETNVVDVYVRYLRSKIDEVYGVKMIRTVRGVGYVIKEEQDG